MLADGAPAPPTASGETSAEHQIQDTGHTNGTHGAANVQAEKADVVGAAQRPACSNTSPDSGRGRIRTPTAARSPSKGKAASTAAVRQPSTGPHAGGRRPATPGTVNSTTRPATAGGKKDASTLHATLGGAKPGFTSAAWRTLRKNPREQPTSADVPPATPATSSTPATPRPRTPLRGRAAPHSAAAKDCSAVARKPQDSASKGKLTSAELEAMEIEAKRREIRDMLDRNARRVERTRAAKAAADDAPKEVKPLSARPSAQPLVPPSATPASARQQGGWAGTRKAAAAPAKAAAAATRKQSPGKAQPQQRSVQQAHAAAETAVAAVWASTATEAPKSTAASSDGAVPKVASCDQSQLAPKLHHVETAFPEAPGGGSEDLRQKNIHAAEAFTGFDSARAEVDGTPEVNAVCGSTADNSPTGGGKLGPTMDSKAQPGVPAKGRARRGSGSPPPATPTKGTCNAAASPPSVVATRAGSPLHSAAASPRAVTSARAEELRQTSLGSSPKQLRVVQPQASRDGAALSVSPGRDGTASARGGKVTRPRRGSSGRQAAREGAVAEANEAGVQLAAIRAYVSKLCTKVASRPSLNEACASE